LQTGTNIANRHEYCKPARILQTGTNIANRRLSGRVRSCAGVARASQN
jgi:hypothetical protein